MSEERWDVPSEKLKRKAEAEEPELRPMTAREKEARYGASMERPLALKIEGDGR